jgi:hypothetical protein
MRFRSKLGQIRIFLWLGYGVIIAAGLHAKGRPPWICALAGVLAVAMFLPPYLFWYWDIRADYFAQRRYFSRIVMPYSEIVYVGPISGRMMGKASVTKLIEIRNAAGKRIIALPSNSEAFLTEMRKHLPEITLNL